VSELELYHEIHGTGRPLVLLHGGRQDRSEARLDRRHRKTRRFCCGRSGSRRGDSAGLPRSQLAVLPGTTHLTVVERRDWLVSMISAFLDGPTSSERATE
jgi:hypothetical protein